MFESHNFLQWVAMVLLPGPGLWLLEHRHAKEDPMFRRPRLLLGARCAPLQCLRTAHGISLILAIHFDRDASVTM
jgi:hypothetical protein